MTSTGRCVRGGKYLEAQGALAAVCVGKGHVVFATYPLLFNALRSAVGHRVD
jgi:hypothetical protein